MRERIELEKIVQSEEILLKGKFSTIKILSQYAGIESPEKRFENKSIEDKALEILIESGDETNPY